MSDEEPEKPDERSRIRPWHVVVIFLTIPALHIASGFAISGLIDEWEKRGQFGDLFGAVNALFSGLAFAGVIVTILLQREELRFQRLELRQTREELRRSAAAQEASEKALTAQAEASALSARLSGISFLVRDYAEDLGKLQRLALRPDDARVDEIAELRARIATLKKMNDKLFRELMDG